MEWERWGRRWDGIKGGIVGGRGANGCFRVSIPHSEGQTGVFVCPFPIQRGEPVFGGGEGELQVGRWKGIAVTHLEHT